MTDLAIINGRVIDPSRSFDAFATVVVRDGKIADITTTKPRSVEVIDASGCIVSPGFIDLHVHFREPGQEYKEDIATGSKAAAAGGFTTVCCMANTDPVNDNGSVTDYIVQRSREVGLTNVHPIGAVSKGLNGEQLADIGDMATMGAVAISDDGRPVMNSSLMRRAMEYANHFGLPVITHAEDLSLGKGVMNEGAVSTELGLKGIPHASEEIMIARDIILAKLTGTHLHVAHVSSRGSVALIRQAKERGVNVTAEVTPHHLMLTDEAVKNYDTNTKMHPPLRTEADRLELVNGLKDGTIDVIATDHAPHNIVDKEIGYDLAKFGVIGLETALPLGLKLVHEGSLSLQRLVEVMSFRPAVLFHFERKGRLQVGYDADIVIFHPDREITFDASRFSSKSRNTPFHGWRVKGMVQTTILAGRVVFSTPSNM